MKTFSRLVLATLIHIVSAVGNLRGDNRGIDTSSSFSSQPENVPKAENGVLAFDLSDVSFFASNLLVHLPFCDAAVFVIYTHISSCLSLSLMLHRHLSGRHHQREVRTRRACA